MKLSMIFKTIGGVLKKNSSGILMGAGIAGFGLSCYFSAKAYDECKNRLEKKKEEIGQDTLPITETIKVCWKPMILPTISFISSSIMVLYSRNIILKKNAALTLAYKGVETALMDFKKETKEIAGEEVYNKIEKQTTIPEKSSNERTFYLDKPLWRDDTYGGYFYATQAEIDKVFFKWSNQLSKGNDISPLDLYYDLHNGEILQRGDQEEYLASDYQFTDFEYHIADYFVIAPNGERASVIFYDLPSQKNSHEKQSV